MTLPVGQRWRARVSLALRFMQSICSCRRVAPGVLAASLSVAFLQSALAESAPPEASSRALPGVQFADGLVSAYIEGTPLGEVLAELARVADVRVRFLDAGTTSVPVLANVTSLPLEAALKSILRDVSYVFYASAKENLLLVLSSGTARTAGGGQPETQLVIEPGAAVARVGAKKPIGLDVGPQDFGSDEHLTALRRMAGDANDPRTAGVALSKLAEVSLGGPIDDDRAVRQLQDFATDPGAAPSLREQAVSGIVAVAMEQSQWSGVQSTPQRIPAIAALRQLQASPNARISEMAREALAGLPATEVKKAGRLRRPT